MSIKKPKRLEIVTDPRAHMEKLYPGETITADFTAGNRRIIMTEHHTGTFFSENWRKERK